jgi:hypothetical protein
VQRLYPPTSFPVHPPLSILTPYTVYSEILRELENKPWIIKINAAKGRKAETKKSKILETYPCDIDI